MDRRAFLKTGAAGAALAVTGAVPALAAAKGASQAAKDVYARVMERLLRQSPMTATGLGLDAGKHAAARSMIDDRTYANRLQTLKPLADALPQLKAVKAAELQGRERSDYETVRWMSEISREIATFPFGGVDSFGYPVPYVLSQLTGIYQAVPDFLDTQHPMETKADAEAYLARLNRSEEHTSELQSH